MDNTLRKAAEMALAKLEHLWDIGIDAEYKVELLPEIEALRTALAQNPLNIADRAYFAGKQAGIEETLAQPEQAHTDHPMRHWDRTCPACIAEPWDTSDMAHRTGGLSAEECIDRGAWSDVPDATKWVDELRGDEDSEQEPVAHLWECLGRWSAYLATNGTQADCAPPDYLVEAIKVATTPPSKQDVNQELVEALTSIAEYWNQDANHDAIVDACHYMTDTAQAILAKHKEQA